MVHASDGVDARALSRGHMARARGRPTGCHARLPTCTTSNQMCPPKAHVSVLGNKKNEEKNAAQTLKSTTNTCFEFKSVVLGWSGDAIQPSSAFPYELSDELYLPDGEEQKNYSP